MSVWVSKSPACYYMRICAKPIVPNGIRCLSKMSKKSSCWTLEVQQEQLFIEIAGKTGGVPHKRVKCQTCIFTNLALNMAGEEGFEPSAYGFGDRRSTSWAIPLYEFWWTVRDSNPGPTGYEPAALPTELTVQSSDLILPPRYRGGNTVPGAPCRIRTYDPAVNSRMLYLLS